MNYEVTSRRKSDPNGLEKGEMGGEKKQNKERRK